MERHGIRYVFEHRMLPQWFFEDTTKFVGVLLNNKDVLYDIINDIFAKENVVNPYSKDDFNVEAAKLTDNVLFVKISFPKPEEEPLCYCSYLLFDEKFEKKRYYCIERGNESGEDLPFICEWTSDGNHVNYGHCGLEEEGVLIRCMELYANDIYGNDQSLPGMDSSVKNMAEDLEEGAMLEEAIRVFNSDRTKEHLLDVLMILRDSYVWIPCNAIMSKNDQARILEMLESAEEGSLIGSTFSNNDDVRMMPDILQKGDKFFFPVFSNVESMGEYGDNFSKVQKHFIEAIHMAKVNEKELEGIVINAFSEPMIIDSELFLVIENIKSSL